MKKRKHSRRIDCVWYGGDRGASAAWNQNRTSRCSGYKLLSAPVGRYISAAFCFVCSLHMASHPNNLRQKQNRADKSTLFVYGGDKYNKVEYFPLQKNTTKLSISCPAISVFSNRMMLSSCVPKLRKLTLPYHTTD